MVSQQEIDVRRQGGNQRQTSPRPPESPRRQPLSSQVPLAELLFADGDLGSAAPPQPECSQRACDFFATDLASVVQRLLRDFDFPRVLSSAEAANPPGQATGAKKSHAQRVLPRLVKPMRVILGSLRDVYGGPHCLGACLGHPQRGAAIGCPGVCEVGEPCDLVGRKVRREREDVSGLAAGSDVAVAFFAAGLVAGRASGLLFEGCRAGTRHRGDHRA